MTEWKPRVILVAELVYGLEFGLEVGCYCMEAEP